MTDVKKLPSCIVLQYEWRLAHFNKNKVYLSSKMKYLKNDSFQAGLKVLSHWDLLPSGVLPKLIFATTDLNKLGLKATGVSFSIGGMNDEKIEEMDLIKSSTSSGETAVQLFTSTLASVSGYISSFTEDINFTIRFTVHLSGIVDSYRINQVDGLLIPQMSSLNEAWTDFKLISRDGQELSVHKFVLAARSSVFAALFSKEKTIESYHEMGCMVETMNRFIKFIYTGKFDGSDGELWKLASKYEIDTLENLCQAASKDISLKEMCSLAMHLQPGSLKSHPLLNVEVTPDENVKDVTQYQTNVSSHKFTWKLKSWTKEDEGNPKTNIAEAKAFEHGGEDPLFIAELKMSKWMDTSFDQVNLKIVSYGHQNTSRCIEEVICSIDRDVNSKIQQQIKLTERTTHDKNLLQIFYISERHLIPQLSCPFFVTFYVKLRSTATNFTNMMIDSTLSQQLWSAAVNRKMTDVEILIGEESFGAHRSLLSARSPVFAAMFASGMKEAETGQIRIEDVDPDTFKHFLKFLYTGMFEPSSMDRELFKIADKYRVETLMELCRPAAQAVDMEDVIKTFFSC